MRNLNKPPRYNVASIQAQQTLGGDVMQSDGEGQYVEFRDYAWLLTEKQRLDNNCDYLDQKLDEEIEKSAMLCGQVERLTKAGDEMALNLTHIGWNICVEAWNAAKEGKQS
jgi:hypothetical protein